MRPPLTRVERAVLRLGVSLTAFLMVVDVASGHVL